MSYKFLSLFRESIYYNFMRSTECYVDRFYKTSRNIDLLYYRLFMSA
mgnify:CR=1 FL=1